MLFLKKLCRINNGASSHNGNANGRTERIAQHNGVRPTAAALQVANPLEHSTRQRFSLLNCGSSRSSGRQFNNRPLCRTPPPVYNADIPATPPPSYTPRRVEHAADDERQEPEVLPLVGHAGGAAADYVELDEASVERRQLALSLEDATNRNEPAATVARRHPPQQEQEHQQQLQRQQHRRRRLQLLQQQRFSNINATSTDSSSSNSDSEVGTSTADRRRRIRRVNGLRDAYCPDLLHACSLILHRQHQQTSHSSLDSFIEVEIQPAFSYSSEYVEIDEIQQPNHRNRGCNNLPPRGSHQARSTPELRAQAQQNVAPQRNTKHEASVRLERVEDHQKKGRESQEMGQNLSLRRPRISLTWVLREQQQQQQQQPQTPDAQKDEKQAANTSTESQNNNNGHERKHRSELAPLNNFEAAPKKRYRVKQLPCSTEPLNGYATTPTAHTPAAAPQKFFSNQNLLDYKDKERTRPPSKELHFVCTPQRLPSKAYADTGEALALAKKRNEIRKKLAAKMAVIQANCRTGDGAEATKTVANGNGVVLEKDELKSLKGTYSEPSLIAASEGNHMHRRHRHRKRRERNRVQKFGYEIRNVDEFLSKCSLASPGNIPVVLSTSSTLYQTRPGGYQIEIPLPLGMVVNAVFKNQNWLYVQTPHAEEGYVGYASCLPLGILPPAARGSSASNKPTPCWESNGDIFPRPCGNMTDSEKEIRLRGGTRSDGARTPRGKRSDAANHNGKVDTANLHYSERHVDKLYLRAASQPKLVEKAYAQLKSTKTASIHSANDEYVTLQQKSKLHVQKHMQQQQQQQQLHQKPISNGPFITNGHNGQHLHPKSAAVKVHANGQSSTANAASNQSQSQDSSNLHQTVLNAARKQHGLRQTLVAILCDYTTEVIALKKGEIVTLCECRESSNRQWFYVKTRDGREGYIPAEVAGHGYL